MQREYGIDVRADLRSMSWRRFQVLLRGLSPNSATVVKLQANRYIGKPSEEVLVMETPEQAERAFSMVFGPPKQEQPA